MAPSALPSAQQVHQLAALEGRLDTHIVENATTVEHLQAAIDLLEHTTGAALDHHFERAAASQANAAQVEYAELHACISSLLTLAMHFHDVCLSTTDNFVSCVPCLISCLHCAHDQIDELACAINAASPPSQDPIVLDALTTIESLMQMVISLLQSIPPARRSG